MNALEARLDPARFIRAHRSAIVQLPLIAALERKRVGDHAAVLKSGARVPVGRSRWAALARAVEGRGWYHGDPNELAAEAAARLWSVN
jgi:DNA-binding LytR/AlgR family response regulator